MMAVLCAEHFRHEHYLCEDTICRQEHFQVWSTEAELHQHRVKVHGDHMSRHEKRQAMRIPLDINVSLNTLIQTAQNAVLISADQYGLWCDVPGGAVLCCIGLLCSNANTVQTMRTVATAHFLGQSGSCLILRR